jgi:hypothetical protein
MYINNSKVIIKKSENQSIFNFLKQASLMYSHGKLCYYNLLQY